MAVQSATRELVQLRTGRDVEEHLRELYVELGHSDREIARLLGVHQNTVTNWRKAFGIERNARTTALS